ncbi:hypothetical protein CMV_003050 [Castanea mollissima]|uniref:Uncharacterized protein n=1 Tax=Castanea mollissima TaxID=60419 RepID=A0A8J4RTW4_9ROSI|nr:hypothetical protein CMV_003050 [Castanea mollissima]
MDQQRWLVKLMGYDYEIEYRPGRENLAADALLRLHGELIAITCPQPTWLAKVRHEAHNDPLLIAMREDLQKDTKSTSGYEARGGQLWYKDRLVLSPSSLYKEAIIREFHDTPIGISVVAWRSAFGVWRRDWYLGVVWRLALGCGFAVGFVWVCCGLHGFGSAWVFLVVVGVGFGGWNGGGYCDWVVVASRCRGGFAWWWLGFFAGWATISWISLEIGGCCGNWVDSGSGFGVGAGAFEVAARQHLINEVKKTVQGRAQLGVEAFANALLVVPKTLAENSGLDTQDVIIALTGEHDRGNIVGLNQHTGEPIDPQMEGIFYNYSVKSQIINSGPVIASQLLLVDEVIRAGRNMRKPN